MQLCANLFYGAPPPKKKKLTTFWRHLTLIFDLESKTDGNTRGLCCSGYIQLNIAICAWADHISLRYEPYMG